MAISFACQCGKQLKVAEQYAGKRAKCPACAGVVTVPVQEALAPEDAAFEMLSADPDPEPARALKPAARQWEEPDQTPYPMKSAVAEAPTTKKSDRAIPKFKAQKMQRIEDRKSERSGITISSGVIGSALLMIGAIVWFVLGLAADRIFFYPPIMFIGGLIGLIRGLMGHSED